MKALVGLVVGLMMFATNTLAHSPLLSTVPADGAQLQQAPQEISLEFRGDIRLTRVTLTYADQPGRVLELGDQTSFANAYVIPLEDLGAGTYAIEWRGLGADGHAMTGVFSFALQ